MDSNKRIIVNTIAQYSRAVVNACISLYTTRIILRALGVSDYGIYSVVAGVVALLGFITNALVITTQRYISFYSGRGDLGYVKKLFSNSLFLHLIIGLVLGLILLSLKPWLFESVLNIDAARIDTAQIIYYITILILMLTILIAPFKAVLIAHENIVYISIVEVGDGLLRLFFVLSLLQMNADTLLIYGFMMLGIQVINLMAYAGYTLFNFPECHIFGVIGDIDRSILSKFTGFAGWTTYGMGSVVLRTQGLAVVLNHFFGTVINAAYGIAHQVYASVAVISTSVLNAMNPQIIKAEGNGDRQRMIFLAEQESKYSEMLMMIVLVPLMFELPIVLDVWLGQANEEMVMMTRFTLIAFMCDQLTYGLNTANQALGNVRNYCILMYTPKLLILPIAYVLLVKGYSVAVVMWVYVGVELLVSLMRIPYIKYTAGLSVCHFIQAVILPLLPLLLCQLALCWLCTSLLNFKLRFLLTIPLSIALGIIVVYFVVLTAKERKAAVNLIRKKRAN